jgi:hypothetical protein
MAYEQLKNTTLPRTLSDVMADVADLFQKEIRLARAEMGAKVAGKVQGSVWVAVAGVIGLLAALLLVEAIALGIASAGLALHWSFLIVAGVLAFLAALAFLKGRADLREEIVPARSLRNIQDDIAIAKEHLT